MTPIARVVDQQQVCKSLESVRLSCPHPVIYPLTNHQFVDVSQKVLNAVVGKKSATDLVSKIAPKTIAQALKDTEAVDQRITAQIYRLAPSCALPTKGSVKALAEQSQQAICAFTPGSAMVGPLCKVVASV
jgi:hypothetical protein